MGVKELRAYVALLEAVVAKTAALRNEAMIRTGDSPMASRAVDEYDAVRSMVFLHGFGPFSKEDRPASVTVGDKEVHLRMDSRGAWLEVKEVKPRS